MLPKVLDHFFYSLRRGNLGEHHLWGERDSFILTRFLRIESILRLATPFADLTLARQEKRESLWPLGRKDALCADAVQGQGGVGRRERGRV